MQLAMWGIAQWIIIAVAFQRLLELFLAKRNTSRLIAEGAVEIGHGHYYPIVMLHAGWLMALFLRIPAEIVVNWWLIGVFVLLQIARIWVISSLGRFWTTRIITLPDAPLVTNGPYRWFRHPNYIIVALELIILPLAFSDLIVAISFSVANIALMFFRIPSENRVLEERRPQN